MPYDMGPNMNILLFLTLSSCCQQHDICYSNVKKRGTCPINDKTLSSVLGVDIPVYYAQTYEFTVNNCGQPNRVTMSCSKLYFLYLMFYVYICECVEINQRKDFFLKEEEQKRRTKKLHFLKFYMRRRKATGTN